MNAAKHKNTASFLQSMLTNFQRSCTNPELTREHCFPLDYAAEVYCGFEACTCDKVEKNSKKTRVQVLVKR